MEEIGFNKPYFTGKETEYIQQAVSFQKISGNGAFTKKCHQFFESRYGFKKTLLTTSCSDALEMAALLIDTKPGDEIIIPSFTFVSTANAFVLRGATIVFADSCPNHPNLDATLIEPLITKKTKAIVAVHYAGHACDMDAIMALAKKYSLFVIEDAAQAIDSRFNNKPLGGIGHLAAFSFHETKNIISGEGGMLVINDERFLERAEIIWEKGTNRSAFWRGEVDKYGWVDIGSSFLPSEIIAAFLFAQLEEMEKIQTRRLTIWQRYYDGLKILQERKLLALPEIPAYATNNGHMFYILCNTPSDRTNIIQHFRNHKINSVFHYLSLHTSPFYSDKHDGRVLPNADRYSECLLRLPFFFELTNDEIDYVIKTLKSYFKV